MATTASAVRLATPADAARINLLADQLGYPASTAETSARLASILLREAHAVFVADVDDAVAGWVHVLVPDSLLADRTAEVAGLVVDEHHRSRGLGQALMTRAEQWAREHGCHAVRLRSNVVRARAHAFYERLGYRVTKTSKVFSKDLAL